jgi:ABC-type transport system substrate-binding protein
MSLEPIDNTAYNKLNASGWNNHLLEMSFSYNGMELKYSTSLTQRLSAKQYTYVSIWTPDDFNKLYNVMLAERDMAKREGYYQQLNKLATDDYCLVVPLLVQKTLTVKSPNLHDFGGGNNTASEFLPETAWLSK